MFLKQTLILLVSASLVLGQRGSFAGTKPIGFPELTNKSDSGLESRFGADTVLPLEANGDRDLIERISKMPVDKQPFWYINWKALEDNRKNPQTYQQRSSPFSENNNLPQNNQASNANSGSQQRRQRRRFNTV